MRDGEFHGQGTFTYPNRQKMEGVWMKGRLVSFKFIFEDGLEYTQPWSYCRFPDRRFNITMEEGFQPPTCEYLTNEQPTREIPPGCYDTVDGFYDPVSKSVMNPGDPTKVVRRIGDDAGHVEKIESTGGSCRGMGEVFSRIPSEIEEEWILKNCRKAGDKATGYNPDLYKLWTNGKRREIFDYLYELDRETSELGLQRTADSMFTDFITQGDDREQALEFDVEKLDEMISSAFIFTKK